jgi:hypothetical protein
MRRRVAETVVVAVLGALGSLVACGDDDDDSAGPSAGSGGELNEAGSAAGEGASAPVGGGESSQGGSPSGSGGTDNAGGVPEAGGSSPSGDAGSPVNLGGGAGETSTGDAGAAGAAPVLLPDLIIRTGGPWPDSLTGRCSTPSKAIPCPQSDDPFFGQDGTYRINVPTYSSTVSTLTDSVTGLAWQINPETVTKTQADALGYCAELSLGGQDDWRLPTRLEYVTMLDEGLPGGFAVPTQIPSGTTGIKWTASASGMSASDFFVVEDDFGRFNVAGSESKYRARCVRGPALAGTLTVGTDTVIDSMTELEWQRTSLDDGDRSWAEALDYCETLTHATKDDWRLPNVKELVTIVDETATVAPAIDEASFGDSDASRYWSSTPAMTFLEERFAFTLDTSFGSTPIIKMTDAAAARCVRSAD